MTSMITGCILILQHAPKPLSCLYAGIIAVPIMLALRLTLLSSYYAQIKLALMAQAYSSYITIILIANYI